jgi:hypothetical protein
LCWSEFSIYNIAESLVPSSNGQTSAGSNRLAPLLDKYGHGIVVTQVVPPVEAGIANYPEVQEYLVAAMNRFYPTVIKVGKPYPIEDWSAARVKWPDRQRLLGKKAVLPCREYGFFMDICSRCAAIPPGRGPRSGYPRRTRR